MDIIERIATSIDEDDLGQWASNLPDTLALHPGLAPELQKLGIDPSKLKPIGSGSRGTAFSDGRSVVKITDDPTEAQAAENTRGKSIAGIVPITYVAALAQKPEEEDPIFVIVQGIAQTNLTKQENLIANAIGRFLTLYGGEKYARNPFDVAQGVRWVYNYLYLSTKESWISPSNTEMIKQILTAVISLHEKGINYFDVQGKNIGKDSSGKYQLFDLGVSVSRKTVLPTLEYLLDDRELPVIL